MSKFDFCQKFIWLKDRPFSLAERAYLHTLYHSEARRLVVRASRQVEKSTFLVNTILHLAVTRPGSTILFVCPREQQARVFSNDRLIATIQNSPLVRGELLGKSKQKPPVMDLRFANRSTVHIRAAFQSADATRGISADMLLVDEFQDIANGNLPILEETLSHAKVPRLILTGTPKAVSNHLESMYRLSTACEFQVRCPACPQPVILDDRCLGLTGPICPGCRRPIDPHQGRWIARNPTSVWGEGFWINHLMVPWLNYGELLERHRTYDPAVFKNECLGLPTALGDHVVTRAELEACCKAVPMAQALDDVLPAYRDRLVAGIDWGGGAASRTILVIGYMADDYRFVIVRFERFLASEDPSYLLKQISLRCSQFDVGAIAADGGGNGFVYNRLLFDQLSDKCPCYGILYSASGHEPVQDGILQRWTVGRSASIGTLLARVKKKTLDFPTSEDCGSFLDEFACEIAEYDDLNRSIKYAHPENQPDDSLHAANYALLVATRAYAGRSIYQE